MLRLNTVFPQAVTGEKSLNIQKACCKRQWW